MLGTQELTVWVDYGKKALKVLMYIGIVAVVLGLSGVVMYIIETFGWLDMFLEWIQDMGLYGNFILMACFAIQGIPFAMGYIPLLLSAGFLYGFVLGFGTAFVGTFFGQHIGYWLSKSLLRRRIKKILRNQRAEVQALVQQVDHHQLKLSLLLRLTPIPFGFQNSLLAVSNVPYAIFTVSSPPGMAVEQVLIIYLGTSFRDFADKGDKPISWQEIAVFGASLGATLVLLGFFVYVGRRVMREANKMRELELEKVGAVEEEGEEIDVMEYNIPDEPTEIELEDVSKDAEDEKLPAKAEPTVPLTPASPTVRPRRKRSQTLNTSDDSYGGKSPRGNHQLAHRSPTRDLLEGEEVQVEIVDRLGDKAEIFDWKEIYEDSQLDDPVEAKIRSTISRLFDRSSRSDLLPVHVVDEGTRARERELSSRERKKRRKRSISLPISGKSSRSRIIPQAAVEEQLSNVEVRIEVSDTPEELLSPPSNDNVRRSRRSTLTHSTELTDAANGEPTSLNGSFSSLLSRHENSSNTETLGDTEEIRRRVSLDIPANAPKHNGEKSVHADEAYRRRVSIDIPANARSSPVDFVSRRWGSVTPEDVLVDRDDDEEQRKGLQTGNATQNGDRPALVEGHEQESDQFLKTDIASGDFSPWGGIHNLPKPSNGRATELSLEETTTDVF